MRRAVDTYTRISSKHGDNAPGSKFGRHLGTDYAAPVGTPIKAPVAGVIISISEGASGGKTIEMDGGGKYWRFLHLNQFDVRPGQEVAEGQVIGRSGKTGKVTGPHLHLDVRKGGTKWDASFDNYFDPEALLAEANRPAPPAHGGQNVGKTITLSKTVDKWAFYRPDTSLPLKRVNRAGELSPKKWGGLSYKIVGNPAPNTYEVNSPSLGRIWLYADSDATIK